jgi:hypothetical protein
VLLIPKSFAGHDPGALSNTAILTTFFNDINVYTRETHHFCIRLIQHGIIVVEDLRIICIEKKKV